MLMFWLLLGSLASSQSLTEINAFCNDNIFLPCTAIQGNRNYRTIIWYKLYNKTGIIRKSDGETKRYAEYHRAADFGADDSLNLSSVRPEDGGTYQCDIWANIGGKNRDSLIHLNVSDCVAPVYLTTTVTYSENATNKTPQSRLLVEEISTFWSVTAFLLVYLIKIALSLIFIKVFQAIKRKWCRRKQQTWCSWTELFLFDTFKKKWVDGMVSFNAVVCEVLKSHT